jgi:hypothetical protein
MEAKYRGWNVREGYGWTIIECDDPFAVREHPLRTDGDPTAPVADGLLLEEDM